jgi:hypothetical protein
MFGENEKKFIEIAKAQAFKERLSSIDSYVLIKSLGKGTCGKAYLARDVRKDQS